MPARKPKKTKATPPEVTPAPAAADPADVARWKAAVAGPPGPERNAAFLALTKFGLFDPSCLGNPEPEPEPLKVGPDPDAPTPENVARWKAEVRGDGEAGVRKHAALLLMRHGLLDAPDVEALPPDPEPAAAPPRAVAPVAQGNPTAAALRAEREARRVKPKLLVDDLDRVEEREVEWLWPGRVPLGTPTVLLGRQGDGKSTLTSWLAANVSSGRPWPDVPDDNEPGSVLILQAEESAGRTIKPRMVGFGYRPGKVHIIKGVDHGDGEEAWFSLAHDCAALADAIERIGDVRLIIIDPLGSYIRGISGYNENEVRLYMQPLFRLAEEYNIAVVLVVHPNKDSEKDILDRVSGSGAITQMSRMSWYLSADPSDGTRRLLSLMKGNLFGATETGVAFRYDSRNRAMSWAPDPVKLRARDVDHLLQRAARDAKLNARPGPDPAAADRAKEFLLELLKAGPTMQSAAQDLALNQGIKESSFRKGLKQLLTDDGRVSRERRGDDGRWWVMLTPPRAGRPDEPPEAGGGAEKGGPEPPA